MVKAWNPGKGFIYLLSTKAKRGKFSTWDWQVNRNWRNAFSSMNLWAPKILKTPPILEAIASYQSTRNAPKSIELWRFLELTKRHNKYQYPCWVFLEIHHQLLASETRKRRKWNNTAEQRKHQGYHTWVKVLNY